MAVQVIFITNFFLGTLYIRRRSQLLRENAKKEVFALYTIYFVYVLDIQSLGIKCFVFYLYDVYFFILF